jgi:hypothetical protein
MLSPFLVRKKYDMPELLLYNRTSPHLKKKDSTEKYTWAKTV